MGAADDVTIEGEVERVTFESAESGFRVLKVRVEGHRDLLTVVGKLPQISAGVRLRARGQMIVDGKHGEQLKASSATELAPSTLVGLEKYLGSGKVPGIGQTYAARIVATFGMDTLRVLDEAPERLGEVPGMGQKRVQAIAKSWKEQRDLGEAMVFLQGHGVAAGLAVRIFRRHGTRTVERVSREPYRLSLDVWGIGFRTADRIARDLGVGADSPQRYQAALLQAVHDVGEGGHAFAGDAELFARAASLLEKDDNEAAALNGDFAAALESLALAELVVFEWPNDQIDKMTSERGERITFPVAMHAAEVRLAGQLVEIGSANVPPLSQVDKAMASFEAASDVTLAPEQRDAIAAAADSPLLVVTGGPGVGKTTIVRAMIATFERAGMAVRLAAPTGRAAKRLSEATEREASTLHRLLEFEPKGQTFKRGAQTPLETGALIVDEASMIDLALADALLQAVAVGTRLVLVGDVDQLPSVGPGAVLRDVIDSTAVRTVRLSKIFRQANRSLIVENAHRIREGEAPVSAPPDSAGLAGGDFFVIERRDPDAALKTILEVVTQRIPKRFGYDPTRDVQVLTPMHRGQVGSIALNAALQAALNPEGPAITRGTRMFRARDKVMQLKNDYDKGVWNGDVGIVTNVDPVALTLRVRFEDGREVDYDGASLDELILAYACTIHKSQGSEYPVVVLPLVTAHFLMLSRNLFYTAVTRGKRLVVLVADPRAVKLALAEDRKHERRTRLAARIRVAAAAAVARPNGKRAANPKDANSANGGKDAKATKDVCVGNRRSARTLTLLMPAGTLEGSW